MAIFFGLLPITIGGIGTRDSALIYLFSSYLNLSVIVAIGLFCSVRYIVPALLGLPFFNAYMTPKDSKKPEQNETTLDSATQ